MHKTKHKTYKIIALAVMAAMAAMMGSTAQAAPAYKVEVVAEGFDTPWSIAFLPDGDMLITELPGQLRLIRRGKLVATPIKNVPKVYYAGQGGLMDVVLHPNFRRNRLIYLTYSAGKPGQNATHVMRARLNGTQLENKKVIFIARPRKDTPVHYGGRMAFMRDGTFLLTIGDGFDYREEAQNLGTNYGAILRLTDDGKVPKDNPFIGRKNALPEIWSYGHRNMQAILVDQSNRRRERVFMNEHGPRGGDEVNFVQAGKNYGWPLITYGKDYSGATISPWTKRAGLEQPIWQWTPSIGPSGMTLYDGKLFPAWRGDLFTTSLVFGHVERLDLKGGKVSGKPEILFKDLDRRLRDIRTGPDGALYLLAETKGQLLRITPK